MGAICNLLLTNLVRIANIEPALVCFITVQWFRCNLVCSSKDLFKSAFMLYILALPLFCWFYCGSKLVHSLMYNFCLFSFFPDIVNCDLKSTLRVLYNLFTRYRSVDWALGGRREHSIMDALPSTCSRFFYLNACITFCPCWILYHALVSILFWFLQRQFYGSPKKRLEHFSTHVIFMSCVHDWRKC